VEVAAGLRAGFVDGAELRRGVEGDTGAVAVLLHAAHAVVFDHEGLGHGVAGADGQFRRPAARRENGNLVGVVVSKLGLKAAKVTGDLRQNVNYAVKSSYALALLEPYLGSEAPEPNQAAAKPRFEDMVAKAQQSVVLILVY
jgi:hypothetical protein